MLLNPCQAIRYSRFAWSSSAAAGNSRFEIRNSNFCALLHSPPALGGRTIYPAASQHAVFSVAPSC